MGVLGGVIEVAVLPMLHARHQLPLGGPITLQFIRDDHPWNVLASLEQLAKEPFGRSLIATGLDQDIENITILIHGAPEIVPLISVLLAKLAAPLPNRFIRHENATREEEFFHIAVAETKAKIEPDGMADDLGRKPMVCVWIGGCGGVHNSPKTVYRHEERAYLSRGTIVEG